MNIIARYKWSILSAVLVLTLLLLPSALFQKMASRSLLNDKSVHAILFGFLTAVFCIEHRYWKKSHPPILPTFLVIGIFAYLTELAQAATRSRHYDVRDFYADLGGIVFGILAARAAAYFWKLGTQGRRK